MRKIILILPLLFLFGVPVLRAQFSGGVIAGMNFSKLSGPSEVDANGNELEKSTFKPGFHIGARFRYSFAEAFGVRAELLYSQKGSDYTYDGASYWIFQPSRGGTVYASGTRFTTIRIVNSYLEVPLMAYLRLGRIEVGGGGYFAYLLRSTGNGEVRFQGATERGSPIDPFTVTLDFNYFDDLFPKDDNTQPVTVDGLIAQVPKSAGAHYETLLNRDENLFLRPDYGLIGNLAVYLNSGLAVSFRMNYGLQDLTRTEDDVARARLDANKQPVFRDDFDRNLTLQASIGFSF